MIPIEVKYIIYLKATGFKLGILYNFGHSDGLEYERKVFWFNWTRISRMTRIFRAWTDI